MKPRISLSFYNRPAWSLAASGKLKKTYNYTKITAIILRPHTSPAGIPTQEIYLGSRCTAPYRLEWTFPHRFSVDFYQMWRPCPEKGTYLPDTCRGTTTFSTMASTKRSVTKLSGVEPG